MLYSIDLSNISHGMSRIQGGGEDTLAWVSNPPPSFMFRKLKNPNEDLTRDAMRYVT